MNSKIKQLQRFEQNILNLKNKYKIKVLGKYIYQVSPLTVTNNDKSHFTLMALVHGNESGNLYVLEEFINLLHSSTLSLTYTITLSLGNYQAFLEGKRFIEKDLNRSFNCKNPKTLEEIRALELSKYLKNSKYLIDFHQTIEKCDRGFFIFPYNSKSLELAKKVHPSLDIITHWGKGFSQDGMCSDEFVNLHGGTGISVETGQQGYDKKQVKLGVEIIKNALTLDNNNFLSQNKIFTWAQIIKSQDDMKLNPNLENFTKIKEGEIIATHQNNKILAQQNGFILFPKYPKKNEKRPQELCRIIKEISPAELPQD
jgi:succinylglutamate desuccinylase